MTRNLIAGTRGSALALVQTRIVIEALQAIEPRLTVEQRSVRTEGDRNTTQTLQQIGGQGIFVKDIEGRLLTGELDFAVHSLKDMPAAIPDGLTIGAVLPRADVRDCLVSRDHLTPQTLPQGARVGTDSRRRVVQLLALRPDLSVDGVRGNVETRLGKVAGGEYDAIILAVAGLERLGRDEQATYTFSPEEMVPAVGQGVLAIECRSDDAEVIALLSRIDDPDTRSAVTAERAFLQRLGAGCRLPVGAFASLQDGLIEIRGLVTSDGGEMARDSLSGPADSAAALGTALAEQLAARAGIDLEATRA